MICELCASKSSDAYYNDAFEIKRDLSKEEERMASAADPTGLHGLYRRAEFKPCNKKLCGLTSHT